MTKKTRPALLIFIAIGIAILAPPGFAKTPFTYSDNDQIDAVGRAQVVNALADRMRDLYVFPDRGERVANALRKKLKDGAYDSVKYASGFSDVLAADMYAICHDLHLHVFYGELPPTEPRPSKVGSNTQRLEAVGSAISKPQKLPGNIGYLEVTAFMPAKYVKKAIADAMAQLADSAALIIDLRKNDGGEPETVALISSYLFDKRTHLNDLYWRAGARTQQFWTDENVSGQKFGQSKPVYVLTSRHTGSAGEEFSYNLKSLKRATLIGDITWGGANHYRDPSPLTDRFYALIPMARAINPITKANWEGTGVMPDVPTSYQTALLVAQKLALQTPTAAEKDQQKLQVLRGRLREVDSQMLLAVEPAPK